MSEVPLHMRSKLLKTEKNAPLQPVREQLRYLSQLWQRWCGVKENGAGRTWSVKRFRGGLVLKAHRLLHHSTLGLRVSKKKQKDLVLDRELELLDCRVRVHLHFQHSALVSGLQSRV